MSFQGADVDGLDKLAQYTGEAADFAESVAQALEIIAAALDAMSWTGWAAAFAAYLRGVVIPWVKTTGRYLRAFASVLALASKEQKEVSGDMPRVSLPAGSWTPITYPTTSTVVAPTLRMPDPTITTSTPGGGAQGEAVRIAAPSPIGQVGPANGGAAGGGARTSSPIGPGTPQTPGGGAVGGGATVAPPPVAPVVAPGVGGAVGGGSSAPLPALPIGGGSGGISGGISGGTAAGAAGSAGGSSWSPGAGGGLGGSTGVDVGAGSAAGIGGGSGAGAPSSPVPTGSGALGGLGGEADGTSSALGSGDAPVSRIPISFGGSLGGSAAGAGPNGLPEVALPDDGGLSPALVAAPLGLAGLGAAALGAARAAGAGETDDDEPAAAGPVGEHRPQGRGQGGGTGRP